MITVPPHFEELDWLEYAQDMLAAEEKTMLESHLAGCESCAHRLASLRRMAAAFAPLQEIREPAPAVDEDRAFVARAGQTASETDQALGRARLDVEASSLPAPGRIATLSEHHVVAALQLAREFFAMDLERSRALIAWASEALSILSIRGSLAWPGLRGAVGSRLAYLRLRDGKTTQALEELAAARIFLDFPMPLRDLELAFWSYVRANCLHNLSRFDEALADVQVAEEIYSSFGDLRHRARARILHAILLCDAGTPEEALPLHESLLHDPDALADKPIYALLYLSYATNLVFVGNLSKAKAAYANTTRLLKASGQDDHLFRVRVGLADIAHREGRLEDALGINVDVRPEFRKRHLPWDEVRRELWIIRELLELERFGEARETCRALAHRAADLSLRVEARRALAYLAQAEQGLSAAEVAAVQEDLERIRRGDATRWSAA